MSLKSHQTPLQLDVVARQSLEVEGLARSQFYQWPSGAELYICLDEAQKLLQIQTRWNTGLAYDPRHFSCKNGARSSHMTRQLETKSSCRLVSAFGK